VLRNPGFVPACRCAHAGYAASHHRERAGATGISCGGNRRGWQSTCRMVALMALSSAKEKRISRIGGNVDA
jgi:hypothetical protein